MRMRIERVELFYILYLEEVKVQQTPQEGRHEAEAEKCDRRL